MSSKRVRYRAEKALILTQQKLGLQDLSRKGYDDIRRSVGRRSVARRPIDDNFVRLAVKLFVCHERVGVVERDIAGGAVEA